MIANPETIALMRSEAVAYAAETIKQENLVDHEEVAALLRAAYLAGANAGYVARCSEERRP